MSSTVEAQLSDASGVVLKFRSGGVFTVPEQERSIAVFDPDAFYPLRSLVDGPFNQLDELSRVERFLRAVLLHDEMCMELEPWADPGEEAFDENDAEPRPRNVVVAIGPGLRAGRRVENGVYVVRTYWTSWHWN